MPVFKKLVRRSRWFGFLGFVAMVGLILATVNAIAASARPDRPAFLTRAWLASAAGAAVLMILAHVASRRVLRCPACAADLSPMVLSRPSRIKPDRIRFCYACGARLDEEGTPVEKKPAWVDPLS